MSLENVLANLTLSRDNFVTALTNKGITVSNTATINQCISLISQIDTSSSNLPTSTPTTDGNVVTIPAGRITETSTVTIGTARAGGTITPGTTSNTDYVAGSYLTSNLVITGSDQLVEGNIKSGVTIFGVTGTYTGSSFDFSAANVSADDMLDSITAYGSDGSLVTGNISTVVASASGNVVTVPKGYIASAQEITVTDNNLIAENIKSGVSIFGVTGSYTASASAGVDFYKCSSVTPGESIEALRVSGAETTDCNGDYIKQQTSNSDDQRYKYTSPSGMNWYLEYNGGDGYWALMNDTHYYEYGYHQGAYYTGSGELTFGDDGPVMHPPQTMMAATYGKGDGLSVEQITIQQVGSWSGYKIDIDNGNIGLSATQTTGLLPGGTTPIVGRIYAVSNNTIIGTDSNLISSNIKNGTTIFGITGSYSGSVSIPSGYIDTTDPNNAAAFTVDGSSVVCNTSGYISSGTTAGIITAATFSTSGTSIVCNAGGYIASGDTAGTVTDSYLVSGNIKSGVTIFGVTGTYTGSGSSALIESNTGPGSCQLFYSVERLYEYDIPQIISFQVPIRQIPYQRSPYVTCVNSNLYRLTNDFNTTRTSRSIKMTSSNDYSYVSIGNGQTYAAIKNGNLVKVYEHNGLCEVTSPSTPVTNVTGVSCAPSGFYVLSNGTVYFTKLDDDGEGNFVMAQLQNKTITKLLNQDVQQTMGLYNKHPAVAIDNNGNVGLIKCDFYDEDGSSEFESNSPITWTEIGTNNNNDPFLNMYFYPPEEDYDGSYPVNILFAIRSSGLWYCTCSLEYNYSTDQYEFTFSEWTQISGISPISTNWIDRFYGATENDYSWNEETGEETSIRNFKEVRIPLFIDANGRLWTVRPTLSSTNTITGVVAEQISNETGWSYVPPSIGYNYLNGSPESAYAQKNGQIVILHIGYGTTVDNGVGQEEGYNYVYKSTKLVVTYESYSTCTVDNDTVEYGYNPSGRLIAAEWHGMWFTTSQDTIDLSSANGTVGRNITGEPGSGTIYGVIYDPTSSSPNCKRVVREGNILKEVATFQYMPAHNFKRCVMDDLANRHVNYYLDPFDSNYKADGTAAVLTGADGDVMVEIPITYWSVTTMQDGKILYLVSDVEFQGSEPHPFFYVSPGGETLRKQYVGAYEACICNASGEPFDTTNQYASTSTAYQSGYKARSLKGTKPWTNVTRETARTAIRENGGYPVNALFNQYLMLMTLIEGGSFNTQFTISPGYGYAGWNYMYTRFSGRCNYGNGTGSIRVDPDQDSDITWSSVHNLIKIIQFQYRGIENPWGHVSTIVDGIVKDDGGYYMTTNCSAYTDNNYENVYTWKDHNWQTENGYVKTFDYKTFFAKEAGGSTTTYLTDYFWYASGPRAVVCSGRFNNLTGGDYIGAGYTSADADLTVSRIDYGFRITA